MSTIPLQSYPSLSCPACHPLTACWLKGLRAVLGQPESGSSATSRVFLPSVAAARVGTVGVHPHRTTRVSSSLQTCSAEGRRAWAKHE
jgi:hypothetical protein